jgi:spermidine/putrescine transport system ATP-binding protein
LTRANGVPVIAALEVTKRYGDFVAVREASFEILRGEFFSMLGPSGCGKTTLLRMIAGFEEITSGVLMLDGADVVGVPPYRRHVNTVFQNYALFPHLSVFENVAFGPRIRQMERAKLERRVGEMLEVVRLGDLAKRKPSQLSGGQRQRVALARALVNDPSALLLDEPLSALDLELRRQMQLELKRIQRDVGITFVFVTHDQEEALTMSDRIAVMRAGRLEQVGTPEEIYGAPESAFVARFIGSANLIPVEVEQSGGDRAALRLPGGRRCEAASGGRSFPAGTKALLMVRPERLVLGVVEPAPGQPSLPVTCSDVVFQGPVLRCALQGAAGGEWVAYLEAARQDPAVRPGASLWLSWEPGAERLLPPDGAASSAGADDDPQNSTPIPITPTG